MNLRRIEPGPERANLLPLLLLADDSVSQVNSYMQKGMLFVACNKSTSAVGSVLAIPIDDECIELKSVAIDPEWQGQGLGQKMLALVSEELRAAGFRRVVLGTGNSGIGQIAFYQKAGFRMHHIERDFFIPEKGYPETIFENGIKLRDMIWFDMQL